MARGGLPCGSWLWPAIISIAGSSSAWTRRTLSNPSSSRFFYAWPTVASFTQPVHGLVTVNPNGSFLYTPANGFSGLDSFSYKVSDGTQTSANTAIVIVKVNFVDQLPIATDDAYAFDEDTTLSQNVLGNDFDEGPMTAVLVAGPTHAKVGGFTFQIDMMTIVLPSVLICWATDHTHRKVMAECQ